MLSTLTIISIFTEIFATAMLISGAYGFLSRFFAEKKRSDLYLGLAFFTFSIWVALTVASQMMYNLGQPVFQLIIVNKLIYFDIAVSSLILWFFIIEKFGYSASIRSKMISSILLLIVAATALSVFASRFDLVYRSDVIEPVISTSLPVASKTIWVTMWATLAALCSYKTFSANSAKRNLLLLSLLASGLILASHVFSEFYVLTADASLLLLSWVLTFFGVMSLWVGEIIPPESKLALEPLNLFRTRILYKLILIFVLLIVVLLEVTTLVTINISRNSLITAIKDRQMSLAQAIADRITYTGIGRGGKLDIPFISKLVAEQTRDKQFSYVVDGRGRVVAHQQETQIGLDLSGIPAIDRVLKGGSGNLEYVDDKLTTPTEVVSSFAKVKGVPLWAVVEEPKRNLYSEIRVVETNSLIFVITGIILAIIVGIFFARSIEYPIKQVIVGTDAVRRGDLSYRINVDTSDEIGQLATAFNQMTGELKETQEHLVSSEKLAALGTMAAGMAHEIKNPLVSLRTFTQLLQQKFDDPEFRKKFAAIVPQEIERINKIAESLLKFGRPTKPELAKVSLNKILEEVLELLENEARRNDIRITTKFANVPDITGDAMQLSQAFVNIVLNAIQSMQKGGELTIKTDMGEVIRLSKALKKGVLKKEDSSVTEGMWGEAEEEYRTGMTERPIPVVFVEITDTGVGIPEESLRTVFDPFYTTKVGGTGMGLPITLRIIEDHKGSIKVKSQMGKGTTFIVTLPQKLEEV